LPFFNNLCETYYTAKNLYFILSRKARFYCYLLFILSFAQFIAELGVALSLQSLLFVWGLISEKPDFPINILFFESISATLIFFLVVTTTRAFLAWTQAYASGVLGLSVEVQIRAQITSYAMQNRRSSIGDVADLFNDKAINTASFVNSVVNTITRVTMVFLIFCYLLNASLVLTLLTVVFVLALAVPIALLNIRISVLSGRINENISLTVSKLLTAVKNSLLLTIYGTIEQESSATNKTLQLYQTAYQKYFVFSSLKGAAPGLFGAWMVCLITYIAQAGTFMNGGLLVAYIYLFIRFVTGLGEIANLTSYITVTLPRTKTILKYFKQERQNISALESLRGSGLTNKKRLFGSKIYKNSVGWKLNDVSFRYPGNSNYLLEKINLEIPAGCITAITGESGSGKTTLLSLLIGLETPDEGKIFLTDEHSKNIERIRFSSSFSDLIGYVGPENHLIPGTIRENLVYGSRQLNDEELLKALAQASCDFIHKLPKGLDHYVSEQGEGLSAGQKQRLSLARALSRKPRILILDEATANLDPNTEELLLKAFLDLRGLVTQCIVTHRPQPLKIADQIIRIEKGAVFINA
jgi:ABC-type multidrug transport system fused ATPase/permease subunit